MSTPDLLALVKEWFNQSRWVGSKYVQTKDHIVCKCCKVMWIKVGSDRVQWVLKPRPEVVDPEFKRYETLAADKALFDQLALVLENAQHDNIK